MREWTGGQWAGGGAASHVCFSGPCGSRLFSTIGTQGHPPPRRSLSLGAQGHGDAQTTGTDSLVQPTPHGGWGLRGGGFRMGLQGRGFGRPGWKPHGTVVWVRVRPPGKALLAVRRLVCPHDGCVSATAGSRGSRSRTLGARCCWGPAQPVTAPQARLPETLLQLLPCPGLASRVPGHSRG